MTFTIPEPAFVRDAAVGVVTDWLDGLSLEGRLILAQQLLSTSAQSVSSTELSNLAYEIQTWLEEYKEGDADCEV